MASGHSICIKLEAAMASPYLCSLCWKLYCSEQKWESLQ